MRFTVLLLLVVLTTDFASAQRRQAKSEALTGMIEALGGDAFLGVREIHTTGRFYAFQKGELNSGDGIFIPTAANLDGNGNINGIDDGAHDCGGGANVAQQRRARASTCDFGNPAAHIDVYNVRA